MYNNTQRSKLFLGAGILAGPIYIVVGLIQILTREGFDMTRHPLSMMSLGDLGWIQIANFVMTGILVVLGAIGLRAAVGESKSGKFGAVLIGIYGIGVIGGGVFVTDPSLGFPPGTPDTYPETMSWHAGLHFIFGQLGFLALIIASFVFGRYFVSAGKRGWSIFSIITGVVFLASIAALFVAMGAAWASIALYIGVALGWVWLSAIYAHMRSNA